MISSTRLSKHLVAAAAATAGIAAAAQAAIVYQVVSINIPDNLDGLYINVVTGATASTGGGAAGWDINPYSAAAGQFNLWGPTANTYFSSNGTSTGSFNLSPGTVIGGADALFFRPGGGTNLAPQFNLNSNQNFIGFRFVNEANGNQVHFGWARIQFGVTSGIRTITEIAYEGVAGQSIEVGFVPAPGALALLGLAGVRNRRRRR